ncbi:MAG: flavin reductase family protein [Oscillospiraceae bacterium]|jgi:flavin reductase (DIM6/NTAB) family NADH-FMN oxidoreductase RutF
MKKLLWKGGALLAPVPPVMVTCGTIEKPNVLTIAWTGILNTIPPKTYISVRPERYSYPMIKKTGEFVINLTTKELVRAADLCGVKSGADCDKLKLAELKLEKSSIVTAPMLDNSPVSIECRVCDIIPLGSHDMFIADIVAVNVSEALVDSAGKLNLDKCGLIAYSHGEYFSLGEKLGTFGFSVRKKPLRKKRANKKA